MATAEEIAKIRLQVEGEKEVERLSNVVKFLRKDMADLDSALARNAISQSQYTQQMASRVHGLADATNGLNAAQARLGQGGGGVGKTAYMVSGLAQAAQDAQYGLKNVENNVLAMTSAMGPWGVAIGIGVTAAIELYTHWDSVAALWGQGHTDTEAERMKKLADATHRTVQESKALRDYQSRQSIIAGGNAPTKEESKHAAAVTEAIRESGGTDALAEALARSNLPGGSFTAEHLRNAATDEERRGLRSADMVRRGKVDPKTGMTTGADPEKARAMEREVTEAIKARLIEQARQNLAAAGLDPDRVEAIAAQLEKAGMGDAATRLRDAVKRKPMGPEKPATYGDDLAKQFGATGESDIIAGPGRFQQRQQQYAEDIAGDAIDLEAEREDERLQRSIADQREGRARRRAADLKRVANFNAANPQLDDVSENGLRRGVMMGADLSALLASQVEIRAKDLEARGVAPDEAKRQAAAFGKQQYAGMLRQGYQAAMDPRTFETLRGVQNMSAEAYMDSVGTAREGGDKAMLDLNEKQADALIFLKEWAKQNHLGIAP